MDYNKLTSKIHRENIVEVYLEKEIKDDYFLKLLNVRELPKCP